MRHPIRSSALALLAAAGLLAVPLVAAADSHGADHERDVTTESSDSAMVIRDTIQQRIDRNDFLEGYDIRPEVKDGVVTLRGSVSAEHEKEKAGEIARNVDGVKRVDNELLVGKGIGIDEGGTVGGLEQPPPQGRGLTGGSGIQ